MMRLAKKLLTAVLSFGVILMIPLSAHAEEADSNPNARTVPHYTYSGEAGETGEGEKGDIWDGEHYYLADGTLVKDAFFCDGIYTYYLQLDGTPMTDRLTYHPDGEHVIYFDEKGHEIFSDFINVKESISGDAVDDLCFFDVYGYMYTNVFTYNKAGDTLYYANPYGVMECGGWFQFADEAGGVAEAFGIKEGTWGYAYSDGSVDFASIGDESNKSEFAPDSTKATIKRTEEKISGATAGIVIGEYDKQGKIIQSTKYTDETLSVISMRITYDYYSNGLLYKEIVYQNSDDLIGYYTYEYDEKGNLLKKTHYDSDDNPTLTEAFEYDSYGNRISPGYEIDKNGNVIKRPSYDPLTESYGDTIMTYTYDEAGNLIRYATISSNDGSSLGYTDYEYDSNGNLIKESRYDADGSLKSTKDYEYDSAGRLIKDIEYKTDGSLIEKNTKDYDKAGNIIKETTYGPDEFGDETVKETISYIY